MLGLAKFLVLTFGAVWAAGGNANAQSGLYKSVLADCMTAGYDHGRCVDYSYCVESESRRDRTPAQQLDDILNPNKPEFREWAARTKLYCRDHARLPPETPPTEVTANDPENTLLILTTAGLIKIALLPNEASKHVVNLKEFVRKKLYDGREFTLRDLKEGSVSIPYDPSQKMPAIPKESAGEILNRGDVAMLDGADFFISRGFNRNPTYIVIGRVADGLNVLDALKAPDTGKPVFGYPPNLPFEPDQVLAVRIAADPNSSDIAKLENEKDLRIAARAKKDGEHARQYGMEMSRLTQIMSSVTGDWTNIAKSPDGQDVTRTWTIKKESDGTAPARRTMYSAVSVMVTIPSEAGQAQRAFQLQGGIERENLTVGGFDILNLASGPARCRVIWKFHAKSPTEFDGVWTLDRSGSAPGCPKPTQGKELTGTAHLQKN